jgi:heptosyltransferase-2
VIRAGSRDHSVLIVAPAWVGDMVMAHSLVRLLQTMRPGVAIDMLAPRSSAPLGERMEGVRAVISMPLGHGDLGLSERWSLGRRLRDNQYAQAIVLPNSFKSALVPWWARVPIRTGWHGEARYGLLNDRRRLDPQRYGLMIERFMALGVGADAQLPDAYPQPELRADADNAARLSAEFGLGDAGITALCPGAEFGPAKRWPAMHYAAVAAARSALGEQVLLLGSPADRPACDEILACVTRAQGAQRVINLAGRTSLLDAIDLLSLADRVITNDSGLMHVACAVQRPVVAVFGSTSPAFTPPLGDKAVVVRNDLPCSPCFERTCPLGHLNCLVRLLPEQVLAEIR